MSGTVPVGTLGEDCDHSRAEILLAVDFSNAHAHGQGPVVDWLEDQVPRFGLGTASKSHVKSR
jgi:hypothetical protein